MFSYKTAASDAAAMSALWFGLAGVSNPSPQAIQWWTKQIQQDGSQPAFDNFKTGKGQDAQSKFDPNVLAQNVQKYTAATKLQPYQPSANVPQFPGTNHKTLVAEAQEPVGNFLKNIAPIAALIPGVGPLVSGALAAAGQAIIPGANLGDAVKAGAVGAAEGAGVGAIGSATGLSGAIGNALGTTSALPGVSPVALGKMAADGSLANVANAGVDMGAGTLGGADLAAAVPSVGLNLGGAVNGAKQVAGAAGGGGLPSASPVSNGTPSGTSFLDSLGTFLPTVAGGLNAANLQGQSQQYAQDALKTQQGLFDQTAPLRTAGIQGMLNPSTPAPGMPEIQALRSIAATGNPFAPKPSAPTGGASPAPNAPAGLPTPSPVAGPQNGNSATGSVNDPAGLAALLAQGSGGGIGIAKPNQPITAGTVQTLAAQQAKPAGLPQPSPVSGGGSPAGPQNLVY